MDAIVPIVLDASVAIKLVISEPDTPVARERALTDEERIAPDWMITEVASALAKKVRYDAVAVEHAAQALEAMPRFVDRFVASGPLLRRALELSAELDHALYDCLYLAVALDGGGRVLTADNGFHASATRAGYVAYVDPLGS